jgi:hypothetical protein
MVLTHVHHPLPYGIVITDEAGRITRFLEKPGWGEVFSDTINTGIYILEPSVFDAIPPHREYDFGKGLFPALLAPLLTVTVWQLLTGGLHLDGLADCLDGLTGRDPTQRLAIMRDSRIGVFGALGLIVLMLLEIAAVTELPPAARWRVLLVVPVVGRAMPARPRRG